MVSVISCLKDKQELRRKISKARDQLSKNERALKSRSIKMNILSQTEYINSQVIFCYFSFKSEVETFEIIKEGLNDNKKVCVPIIDRLSLKMFASELTDIDNTLQQGYYGILEPKEKHIKECPIEEIDLVFLPGLAFDCKGYRLGYGKGFYDKFLQNKPSKLFLIGLAYELQVVKFLPAGSEDIPVNKIITEDRVIDIISSGNN